MKIVGVDPGVTGAVAVLDKYGRVTGVYDCPIYHIEVKNARAKKTKKGFILRSCYDIDGMLQVAEKEHTARRVIIEEVNTFDLDPVSAALLVSGMELWTMAFLAAGVDVERVVPSKWKKQAGIARGADKDAGRLLALERHPEADELIKFKKNHNRSDAILLADWGYEALNGGPR